MITGPPGTPYAFAMFEFDFIFPADYPTTPPKVLSLTTNNKQTRFNPNIYSSGKVCLSILGTWTGEPGEQWSSVHGVLSVLLSIQSLMCEKPYHNEPGFEGNSKRGTVDEVTHYNNKIMHETIRISICQRLESYLRRTRGSDKTSDRKECAVSKLSYNPFDDTCKRLFLCYYQHYLKLIDDWGSCVKDGEPFICMPFESLANGMNGSFNYADLRKRINSIYGQLTEEGVLWVQASRQHLRNETLTSSNLKGQFEQIIHSKEFDGLAEIELQDQNPFEWTFTIFGRPMSAYDGGIFRGSLIFHELFPEVLPIIHFTTPIYHPNVSTDGYPFVRPLRSEDIRQLLAALVNIFIDEPNPHPATHLDTDAASQFFGDKNIRKNFNQQARRCASRSVEY